MLEGIESTHQEGWALAVLTALCAEADDAEAARRRLEQATRLFESLDSDAGLTYCRELGRRHGLAAGSAIAD